jgi:ribonuclease HI
MNFTIQTDGGSRGNPGKAAIGLIISRQDGTVVQQLGKTIGIATNNVAEYTALLMAWQNILEKTKEEDRGEVTVKMDSELVVKQMTGEYRIKDPTLLKLAIQIKSLEKRWGRGVLYQHVPRNQNSACDALVNQALDREQ